MYLIEHRFIKLLIGTLMSWVPSFESSANLWVFFSKQEILRSAELYSPVFAGHNITDADDVMNNDLVGGLMSNVSEYSSLCDNLYSQS